MRDQYDFTGGERGKYYHAIDHGFGGASVVIDPRIPKNIIAIVNGLQVMVKACNDGSKAIRKFLVTHKRLKGKMRYRRAYDRRRIQKHR